MQACRPSVLLCRGNTLTSHHRTLAPNIVLFKLGKRQFHSCPVLVPFVFHLSHGILFLLNPFSDCSRFTHSIPATTTHIWLESKFVACLWCTWLIHVRISLVLLWPYIRSVDDQQVKSSKDFRPLTIEQAILMKVRTLLLFTTINPVLLRPTLIKLVTQKYHLFLLLSRQCAISLLTLLWAQCKRGWGLIQYLHATWGWVLLLNYFMHLTVINAPFVPTIPYSRSITNKSSLARFSDLTLVQAMHLMIFLSVCLSLSLLTLMWARGV
jgi:hypothetical protein